MRLAIAQTCHNNIANEYTSEQIMLHSLVCMVIGFFVAENLKDSSRTAAGGDRKVLEGSKQEGRCGWMKFITAMKIFGYGC